MYNRFQINKRSGFVCLFVCLIVRFYENFEIDILISLDILRLKLHGLYRNGRNLTIFFIFSEDINSPQHYKISLTHALGSYEVCIWCVIYWTLPSRTFWLRALAKHSMIYTCNKPLP